MNKIIVIITVICLINIITVNAKNREEYYFYSKKQIEENKIYGKHRYYGVISFDFNSNLFYIGNADDTKELIDISAISTGRIYKKNNCIICYDKRINRKYIFNRKDSHTIEVANNTAIFNKGTKLYLSKMESEDSCFTSYLNEDDLINSDYWKTGNKNGIWSFINSKQIKLVYYTLNSAKDSIIANDMFTKEVDNFVKKYSLTTTGYKY